MSIAVVQSVTPTASSSSASLQSGAFSAAVTSGNTILVFVWYDSVKTTTGVTDTAGNTYVKDAGHSEVNNNAVEVWRASNVTGGAAFKVTVNLTGATFVTIEATEIGSLTSTSPMDGSGSANDGSGNSVNTGAFSTTNSNVLLLATFADGNMSGISAAPAGFTLIGKETSGGTFEDGAVYYQIVSSPQTGINPAWTTTGAAAAHWAAIGLAYKGAGGPWPWFFDSQMSGGMHCQGGI